MWTNVCQLHTAPLPLRQKNVTLINNIWFILMCCNHVCLICFLSNSNRIIFWMLWSVLGTKHIWQHYGEIRQKALQLYVVGEFLACCCGIFLKINHYIHSITIWYSVYYVCIHMNLTCMYFIVLDLVKANRIKTNVWLHYSGINWRWNK